MVIDYHRVVINYHMPINNNFEFWILLIDYQHGVVDYHNLSFEKHHFVWSCFNGFMHDL